MREWMIKFLAFPTFDSFPFRIERADGQLFLYFVDDLELHRVQVSVRFNQPIPRIGDKDADGTPHDIRER